MLTFFQSIGPTVLTNGELILLFNPLPVVNLHVPRRYLVSRCQLYYPDRYG